MSREMSPVFMIQAKELFDAGKFSAAIMTLQEGLQQYPTFISARVLLGEIYWTSGETALARTELEQVIKAVPDNFAAHRKLALIYREAGELPAAIQSCRNVLQVNPRDLEMRSLLDQLQTPSAHAGEVVKAEAKAALQAATSELASVSSESITTTSAKATEPDSIDSETLAELYIIQGHREKGLLVYHRLAEKYPANPRYRDRIEALERPAALQQAPLEEIPGPIHEETSAKNRRRLQARRLEGWLQVIRTRRRL
jgi:tetratricopeptide (TPR) repeat protein